MNKSKKTLSYVMAFMLVLCVGYFSVMSKTSAWFYDSGTYDSGDSFVFGNLSVNTNFVVRSNVALDGATKLADEKETLFDSAVHVDEIKVTNSGTVTAKVQTNLVNNGNGKGLRWFVYTDDMLVNGSIKDTIKKNVSSLDENGLNKYNESKFVYLAPNETKVVKIACWIEYDEVADKISTGNTLNGYNTVITLTASQGDNGAGA